MGMLQRPYDVGADAYRQQMRLPLEVAWDSNGCDLSRLVSPYIAQFPRRVGLTVFWNHHKTSMGLFYCGAPHPAKGEEA
jgi:hypothetical protein